MFSLSSLWRFNLQAGEKTGNQQTSKYLSAFHSFTVLRLSVRAPADRFGPTFWTWAPDCSGKSSLPLWCSLIFRPAMDSSCPCPHGHIWRARTLESMLSSHQECRASAGFKGGVTKHFKLQSHQNGLVKKDRSSYPVKVVWNVLVWEQVVLQRPPLLVKKRGRTVSSHRGKEVNKR